MELIIIDFDKKFEDYMKKWLNDNNGKFKNLDDVETCMPNLYNQWLNTPADWLNNELPNEYFNKYDSSDLIKLMVRYANKNIGIPDPLLDAIVSKKENSIRLLADIIFDKTKFSKNIDMLAIKITALNLLNEIDSKDYIEDYIKTISNECVDEGISEIMIGVIKQYAKNHQTSLMSAFCNATCESVKIRLIDIMVELDYNEKVYDELINIFINSDNKALFASYLGKYGNDKACEILNKALDWININYLDYVDIRNAIEALGQVVSHSRNFEGDMYYDSMKGLNNG